MLSPYYILFLFNSQIVGIGSFGLRPEMGTCFLFEIELVFEHVARDEILRRSESGQYNRHD